MTEVLRSQPRYPKKDEHRGSSSRCEWCGKQVLENSRFLNYYAYRNYRLFCSRPCKAGGRFYTNIILFSISIVFLVSLVILSSNSILTPVIFENPDLHATVILFEIIIGIVAIWQLYVISLGFKVRKQNSH